MSNFRSENSLQGSLPPDQIILVDEGYCFTLVKPPHLDWCHYGGTMNFSRDCPGCDFVALRQLLESMMGRINERIIEMQKGDNHAAN